MVDAKAEFDVQSNQFKATELTNIIDHFLCKLC